MKKSILNLVGAQELTKKEQKNIHGGGSPSNCKCFCYVANKKVSHSCFSYCSDGTIPGLEPGSTGNCSFNL